MTRATVRTNRFGLLLAVAVLAASLVALVGSEPAEAGKRPGAKVLFTSNRTTGQGVNNPTGDLEIFSMKPDGTGLKQLTRNAVDDSEPALSPNGKKIAYTSKGVQPSNPEGDEEIYLMNADGSNKKNLTFTGGTVLDLEPDFSPGGKKIAFRTRGVRQQSNAEGDDEVYVMTTGGLLATNLTHNGTGVSDAQPDFSPEGKVAFTSNRDGDFDIYAMEGQPENTTTNVPRNLTNNSGITDSEPDFSPNGNKIAYTDSGGFIGGDSEIYLMNANGTTPQNLTNTGSDIQDYTPDFSPDGKRIAFTTTGPRTSNPQGDNEIYTMNALDGSNQKLLTRTGGTVADFDPAWARKR
jgi:TolB protein